MNVLDRFLKYISYDTTSDGYSGAHPSTERQKVFAAGLVREMKDLGISDARMDEHGYVYGSLPATPGHEGADCIGLIAHMDTASSMPGADIKPRVIQDYDGGDILLSAERQVVLSPREFPELSEYTGMRLVVTDGTTLLGGDDKAGVAEIMSMAQQLIEHPELPHGRVAIGFTPDEEIGEGADFFDVAGFGAQYAYTLDGGRIDEMEYENFNAASALVVIHGVNTHPGSAKGVMKNAILMGMEFHQMLPVFENPACTSGYEGFSHLGHFHGDEEKATLEYIVRDHDLEKLQHKKALFEAAACFLNQKYGPGTVELSLKDSYYNMKQMVEPHPEILDRARQALAKEGVTLRCVPIRGGTDGARLSFMGLPCPNLPTGGHNPHGRFEFVCVDSMETMVRALIHLVRVDG